MLLSRRTKDLHHNVKIKLTDSNGNSNQQYRYVAKSNTPALHFRWCCGRFGLSRISHYGGGRLVFSRYHWNHLFALRILGGDFMVSFSSCPRDDRGSPLGFMASALRSASNMATSEVSFGKPMFPERSPTARRYASDAPPVSFPADETPYS